MSELQILVDADACPVKEEVYRVALRHEVPVVIVANSYIRIPEHRLISRQIVTDGFDAADDWIAEQAGPAQPRHCTADILLAQRALEKGARVSSARMASPSPMPRLAMRSPCARSMQTSAPASARVRPKAPRLSRSRTAPEFPERDGQSRMVALKKAAG
jgi:hypothetical protein